MIFSDWSLRSDRGAGLDTPYEEDRFDPDGKDHEDRALRRRASLEANKKDQMESEIGVSRQLSGASGEDEDGDDQSGMA